MAIDIFGGSPVTVVMQTTSDFNGGTQSGTPTLSPGLAVYPAQTGGGLLRHSRPLKITSISMSDGHNATITMIHAGVSAELPVGSITNTVRVLCGPYVLPAGSQLKIVSSGGSAPKTISITAVEVGPYAGL